MDLNIRGLSEATCEWLESRGIGVEIATRFDLYTATVDANGDVVPDMRRGGILVFPCYEHDILVNEKFRLLPKERFWQRKGGTKTFFNADVLFRPEVTEHGAPVIITEGELDTLVAIQAGKEFTMSVPDGAPPASKPGEEEVEQPTNPEADRDGKFQYLYRLRAALQRVRQFILAVDSDPPGQRLAGELVRRFGAARCSFVEYPPGCKDLNDVLQRYGAAAVVEVLERAKPYPVRGLYRLSDYPERQIETFSSGWPLLDQHLMLMPGEFMVVTGVPGHGKTVWILNLLAQLAENHAWRSALFSPEMRVMPYMRNRLRAIKRGSEEAHPETDAWIEDNFVFLDADPTGVGTYDSDFDLQWILDRAVDAVLRYGIRVLVIDPWNEIEHAKRKDEMMVDYIGRAIRMLKRFGRLHEVVVIVVAHPTKEVGRDGKYRCPSLYDIDGAAHWFNKADHGIVVERPPDAPFGRAKIHVCKSKMEELGFTGTVAMQFDRLTCRYRKLEEGDHEPTYTKATGSVPRVRAEPDPPF
jgi:twinkle protein